MSKLLSHRAALCNIVRRIAVEAGEVALEYFDGVRVCDITDKDDGSPVTCADRDAEILIETRLREHFPDMPIIGEEAFAGGRRVDLRAEEYFWLLDPVDGTRAFIQGKDDFTVNIALIHKGEPILGVVYAPALGELYAGFLTEDGGGRAYRHFEDSDNEKDIHTRKMPPKGVVVMSTNYKPKEQAYHDFLEQFKVEKIQHRASSLKICLVASGKADIYPRFGPTGEWDTAAGHAILRAAGGDIVHIHTGVPLRYGVTCSDTLLNPHFLAASGDVLAGMEFPEAS